MCDLDQFFAHCWMEWTADKEQKFFDMMAYMDYYDPGIGLRVTGDSSVWSPSPDVWIENENCWKQMLEDYKEKMDLE